MIQECNTKKLPYSLSNHIKYFSPFLLLFFSMNVLAQTGYFTANNCNVSGCHDFYNSVPSALSDNRDTSTAMPETCNGCHAHGTQLNTISGANQNLIAETRKNDYVDGELITIDFNGGNARWRNGWMKATLYDQNGDVLDSNRGCFPENSECELPVVLQVEARTGMTGLFVGWLGYNMDKTGGQVSDTLAGGIGEGNRFSSEPNHVEVIIATNTFSVSARPIEPRSGGGKWDIIIVLILIVVKFYRAVETSKKVPQNRII